MSKEDRVKIQQSILEIHEKLVKNPTQVNSLYAIAIYLNVIAIILLEPKD